MTNRWTSRNCDSGNAGGKKRKQNETSWNEDDDELEVLLELQEYKNIIKSKRSQLLDKITENVISITGQSDVQVHTLRSSRKASSSLRVKQKKRYLLQRYVNEWKAYVNCDSTDQVKNRDWLTVTVQPGSSSNSCPTLAPQNEPTKATTAVKPNHSKCSKSRSTAVTVFLLKNFMSGTKVPKNAVRRQMLQEERCKTLYLTRDDNPKHVEEIIKSTFDLESYTILDCDKRCNLFVSPLKTISGKQAIERRKALYLCEEVVDHEEMAETQLSDTGSTSTSEVDEIDSNTDHGHHLISLPHRSRPSKSKGKQLKVPDNISDIPDQRKGKLAVFDHEEFDSDCSLDQYFTSLPHKTPKRKRRKVSHNIMNNYDGPSSSVKKGNLVEPIVVIDSSDEEKQELTTNLKGVSDWHALRLMQDEEYEISVRMDKEKQKVKEAELMRKELQEKLSDKWLNNLNTCTTEGLKLSLRLPNSQKLDCSLSRNSSTKTIYEIAFGVGGISKPFKVYTIRPRRFISMNSTVNELSFPQTLVIEEDEDATDPVVFLSQDTSQPDHDIKDNDSSNPDTDFPAPKVKKFLLSENEDNTSSSVRVPGQATDTITSEDSAGNHHTVLPPTTLNVADESPGLRLEQTLDYSTHVHDNDIVCSTEMIVQNANDERLEFMEEVGHIGVNIHHITRKNIFSEIIALYSQEDVALEYPLRVNFTNERAIDLGGVTKDAFSAFFNEAYLYLFDGASSLHPAMHASIDLEMFQVLGRIISHAYLAAGVLPDRIAFPCLAIALLGVKTKFADSILQECFISSLSTYESSLLRSTANCNGAKFSSEMERELTTLFSSHGCREIPRPGNFEEIIIKAAKFTFITKPAAALQLMNSGVNDQHAEFWRHMTVDKLYTLFNSLSVSPAKVLKLLEEPILTNSAEEQVWIYLRTFIGNMNTEEIRAFFRFVTGSSVITVTSINVTFNSLDGLARRPLSHTCSGTLELSSTYKSFPEFAAEFQAVITNTDWCMDAF